MVCIIIVVFRNALCEFIVNPLEPTSKINFLALPLRPDNRRASSVLHFILGIRKVLLSVRSRITQRQMCTQALSHVALRRRCRGAT